jgi:hypothetical protein
VVLATVAALVILVSSFPLSVLLSQRHQLSAEASQLSQLQHQNAALAEQHQQLNSNAEVERLAQQNYQLVAPGKSLFVILPPAGQTTGPGSSADGDPANQPLVSPSQAPNMSPDPGLPQSSVPSGGNASSASARSDAAGHVAPGFWSRVTSSLEFWK